MSDADTLKRVPLEIFNKGKVDLIDKIFAEDFVDHLDRLPGMPPGRKGLQMFVPAMREAFPDLHFEVTQQLQDGDLHVGRVVVEGTMQGDFAGMPATGRKARWEEIHISRFRDGKIVEHWAVQDRLGMLQQLGLAPMPGA